MKKSVVTFLVAVTTLGSAALADKGAPVATALTNRANCSSQAFGGHDDHLTLHRSGFTGAECLAQTERQAALLCNALNTEALTTLKYRYPVVTTWSMLYRTNNEDPGQIIGSAEYEFSCITRRSTHKYYDSISGT